MSKTELLPKPIEITITGDEIAAILNSRDFLNLFFRQNQQLVKHDYAQELGFCLLRSTYKPEYKIIEDQNVDINSTGLGKAAAQHASLLRHGFLSLIDTHFHPYPETQVYGPPFIIPSVQDLSYIHFLSLENQGYTGFGTLPIECIAFPVSRPPVWALLFQSTPPW